MRHLNIEIKAWCAQPGEVRSFLQDQQAEYRGLDHQIDTYFNVRHGRLKLRQGTIENALIHYEREEKTGPKQSNVLLYQAAPDPTLKEILTKALGILVVVEKQRQIYFLGNVKFHIDTVPQLGSFVEIEAIDQEGTIGRARLLRQCQKFCQELGVVQQDLVPVSYSDLLLQQDTLSRKEGE
jgi:adenylate cyclase, class 2